MFYQNQYRDQRATIDLSILNQKNHKHVEADPKKHYAYKKKECTFTWYGKRLIIIKYKVMKITQ